ncbi:hypothetical protein HanRHA438_Chr14g0660231 [Helianthus annuus]|nr:hypothetical protein HanRHA438_Chr14g0660231 [Helianthus annuus]
MDHLWRRQLSPVLTFSGDMSPVKGRRYCSAAIGLLSSLKVSIAGIALTQLSSLKGRRY